MKRKMEVKFGKDKLIFKLDELVNFIEREFVRKDYVERTVAQIERVMGGFKLVMDPNTKNERELVFQFDDSEYEGVRAFVPLLFNLIEYFGLIGSRYDRERIYIYN